MGPLAMEVKRRKAASRLMPHKGRVCFVCEGPLGSDPWIPNCYHAHLGVNTHTLEEPILKPCEKPQCEMIALYTDAQGVEHEHSHASYGPCHDLVTACERDYSGSKRGRWSRWPMSCARS